MIWLNLRLLLFSIYDLVAFAGLLLFLLICVCFLCVLVGLNLGLCFGDFACLFVVLLGWFECGFGI